MRFYGLRSLCQVLGGLSLLLPLGQLANAVDAFKVGGKVTTMETVAKELQGELYDLEKKRYDAVQQLARDRYMDFYWAREAQKAKTSAELAKKAFYDKATTVSDAELAENVARLKDHPQLKSMKKEESEQQIKSYLVAKKKEEADEGIFEKAFKSGELKVLLPEPREPIYALQVHDKDHVLYGPEPTDTSPKGCAGDKCAITVVEYSEFECPFCSRVIPDAKRILGEYRGKIRWIVRDFPLSFHARAKPAAIAAKCAAAQGKYWQMYLELFNNQRALEDNQLKSYAQKIGVDTQKFDACFSNPPKEITEAIETNIKTASKAGVTGTPAFFINGRRLSGALPYGEFKKVIDAELKGGKRS